MQNETLNYSTAEYAAALAKIVVYSGMSSELEDYETTIIIEFLRKYYKPRPHPHKADITINSPDYLVKVWEFGTARKFPMPENYSKLSCDYIGKVMAAFREWRRSVNMRKPTFELPKPALPPKSEKEVNKSIVFKEFQRYKEKGQLMIGAVTYDALVELDQFDTNLWEDYKDLADKLENSERSERGKNSGDLITYRTLMNSITPKTLQSRAKTLAVEEYFRTIETKEDLGL